MRPYPDIPIWMRPTDWELPEGMYNEWPKERTAALLELKKQGYNWPEIAFELGMHRDACRKKYYLIRGKNGRTI